MPKTSAGFVPKSTQEINPLKIYRLVDTTGLSSNYNTVPPRGTLLKLIVPGWLGDKAVDTSTYYVMKVDANGKPIPTTNRESLTAAYRYNSARGEYDYSIPRLEEVGDWTPKHAEVIAATRNPANYISPISMRLGTDPEVFCFDGDTGRVIPAWKYCSKPDVAAPYVPYPDGPQAEFTTLSASCLAYHTDNVRHGLLAVQKAAKAYKPSAYISLANTCKMTKLQMKLAPPEMLQFGCKPSLNAYGLEGALADTTIPLRSAGVHAHFGLPPISEEMAVEMVKALDAIAGVFMTAWAEGLEDPERRRLYGLPGEYRMPAFNRLEYRVLGPALFVAPEVWHITWEMMRQAIMLAYNGLRGCWNASDEEVINALRTNDVAACRGILERNKSLFLALVGRYFTTTSCGTAAYNLAMRGYRSFNSNILRPGTLADAWMLEGGWRTHSNESCATWVHEHGKYLQAPKAPAATAPATVAA